LLSLWSVEPPAVFARLSVGQFLGGARILSADSVRLMGQNQIGAIFVESQPAADPSLTRPFPLRTGYDQFGFGFQVASVAALYQQLHE
jgi:hypothetical protein